MVVEVEVEVGVQTVDLQTVDPQTVDPQMVDPVGMAAVHVDQDVARNDKPDERNMDL